jgi:DNA polymerase III alpha subunit
MHQNKFSEIVYSENDLFNLTMQGHAVSALKHVVVDTTINLNNLADQIDDSLTISTWKLPHNEDIDVDQFDLENQAKLFMPQDYFDLDIAEHVLSLCQTQEEIQRCGHELLLYQEYNMFDYLRYMKFLVDTMSNNGVIWGVGRGSSVASYVLYKLGVHKIDSLYYDLDPHEFLR